MLGTQHGQVVIILQLCMEKKKSKLFAVYTTANPMGMLWHQPNQIGP